MAELKTKIELYAKANSVDNVDNSNNVVLKPFKMNLNTENKKSSSSVRTNPAFMGSNPVDILKNLQIGNRTQ